MLIKRCIRIQIEGGAIKRSGLILAMMAGLSMTAAAQPQATLSTFGIWPLCVAGLVVPAAVCNFTPVYELLIAGTDETATGYTYTVQAKLEDGTTASVAGTVRRDDNQYGYTAVAPITLGGIVQSTTIIVQATYKDVGASAAATTRRK